MRKKIDYAEYLPRIVALYADDTDSPQWEIAAALGIPQGDVSRALSTRGLSHSSLRRRLRDNESPDSILGDPEDKLRAQADDHAALLKRLLDGLCAVNIANLKQQEAIRKALGHDPVFPQYRE